MLAATGLLGIGYEVLVVRVLSQVAENTVYTFAILLAVYLVGTALGAAAYSRWRTPASQADPLLRTRLLQMQAAACLLGIVALAGAGSIKTAALNAFGPGMGAALAVEALLALAAFLLPTIVMGALFSQLATAAGASAIRDDVCCRVPLRRLHPAQPVMTPLLGRPLSSFIFIDGDDPAAVKTLNQQLMQTEITQPAVLAVDIALTRLLAAYGVQPDMVMGHSLGEYGALVAAGALTLPSALEAVSARGREMTKVSMADNGAMAAVFAPMADIRRIVDTADGYVVIANINSTSQAVVGGATDAVERIIERFSAEGFTATRIPVSHAFHTSIVAPASGPFVDALRRLELKAPTKPVVANVTGEFYPAGATAETVLEFAGRQIASPVQFVKGLETLYGAGARVFIEVGPKKALHGFVEDVLGSEHDDVVALFTNHPKVADDVAFNQALCGLYAAGVGLDRSSAAMPREDEDVSHVTSTANGTGNQEREHDLRGAATAGPDQCRRRHDPRARAALRRRAREGDARVRRHRCRRSAAERASGAEPAAPGGRTGRAAGPRARRRHRRRPRPARHRADLRRRQRRPDPVRPELHQRAGRGHPAADGRHAHHPAGQGRRLRGRQLRRRSTTPPTSSSSPGSTRRSTSSSSSGSTGRATRPSTRRPGWRSAPASTPCATPASRSS